MLTKEVLAFEAFWAYVRRSEEDIHKHAHQGHPPPDTYDDPWDEGFNQAYELIRPYLRSFRRKRIFIPPKCVPMSAPYKAETGHQALMFFLNPPQQIYGSAEALGSSEYLTIKDEALSELKKRQESTKRTEEKRKTSDAKTAKEERDGRTLFDVIKGHLLTVKSEADAKPLTWKELQARMPQDPEPWGQSKISRVMGILMEAPGRGMEAYKALYRSRERRLGFVFRDGKGQRSVDAAVHDPEPKD